MGHAAGPRFAQGTGLYPNLAVRSLVHSQSGLSSTASLPRSQLFPLSPSRAGQRELGCRKAAAASSTGAEAVGGQAQPGLFYRRLFPAKKRASDTSTPHGTSCCYPARGRGVGARHRGSTQLLGLAQDGEGAWGQDSRVLGKGHLLPQAGTDPVFPTSSPPAHWTSSPLNSSLGSEQAAGPLVEAWGQPRLPLPQHSRGFELSDSLLQPFLEIPKNNRAGSSSHMCLGSASSQPLSSLLPHCPQLLHALTPRCSWAHGAVPLPCPTAPIPAPWAGSGHSP